MAETSPHDLVAERAVLGGILVDNVQIAPAQQRITAADFFRDVHKQIFASMVRLAAAGSPIDPVTLMADLGHVRGADVSMLDIVDLTAGVPRAVNVPAYADVIAEKSRSRALLADLDKLKQRIYTEGPSPDLLIALSAAVTSASRKVSEPLALTSIESLMAEGDDAIDWLVEDRFTYGSVNLIAGRPKAGKSTVARALLLAVGRGDTWLGSRCRFGSAWYVALEDKRSEVRRHLRNMGATGAEPIRFFIGSAPSTLLADIEKLIASGDRPDLLIIDTAQRMFAVKDTNDYALVTAAFSPILSLAREHNVCIVLLHHAGKADRAGIEAILGSTAWAASVDNVMLVNRTERHRLVSTVQRIGPDIDETLLLMDETTGDVRLGGSRYLADLDSLVAGFVEAIETTGADGITRADLLAAVQGRATLKVKALERLQHVPTVERIGAGTRNDPHRYRSVGNQKPTPPERLDSSSLVPPKGWELETRTVVPPIETASISSSRVIAGSGGFADAERL